LNVIEQEIQSNICVIDIVFVPSYYFLTWTFLFLYSQLRFQCIHPTCQC